MKFDFVIGNPPYQDEYQGESSGANSIYDRFMEVAFAVSDCVELITPARFLFNAGSTPKSWNEKMLKDPHFKVIHYESDASKLFPNVEITGGVAITYRNEKKEFGAIEIFTAHQLLNTILKKVRKHKDFSSISDIVVTSFAYHFTKKMHEDHPEAASMMSKGHAFDLKSNCLETLAHIFVEKKPSDDYICILGRIGSNREYRFIRREYVNNVVNLDKYKLFLSKADGAAGTIGKPIPARIIGTPIIGEPGTGSTETFFSIGCFDSEIEVQNLSTYIKCRFTRAMLGVLKVTQDITPSKWTYVPKQDFTLSSDIDWSQSIPQIDQQLYRKYGLTDEEITFIETHVKEMN